MLKWLLAAVVVTFVAGCSDDKPAQPDGAAAPEPATPEAPPAPVVPTGPKFFTDVTVDKSSPGWKQQLKAPAPLSLDDGSEYFWELETNKGTMRFKLHANSAPMHVTSTIYLTELGFYDDVIFHRVIPGFMAQGGDPTGTGRGGPGYNYAGEFSGGEKHDRPGLLSMANAGPGTDGSQFFITFLPTPWLDGKHTIFGEIVSGIETVQALEAAGTRGGTTTEPLVISRASIAVEPAGGG